MDDRPLWLVCLFLLGLSVWLFAPELLLLAVFSSMPIVLGVLASYVYPGDCVCVGCAVDGPTAVDL